jgi:hypothetical protein
MKLNIITTATIRPNILNITYKNFFNKINFPKDTRLIINIDKIGETNKYNENSILNICRKYLNENQIKYNISNTPSFAKAVK